MNDVDFDHDNVTAIVGLLESIMRKGGPAEIVDAKDAMERLIMQETYADETHADRAQ